MIRYGYFSLALLLTLLSALGNDIMAADTEKTVNKNNVQVDWAQYDGQRVKGSDSVWVYLILRGRLCLIPDPTTYLNLFADWNGISVNNYLVNNIPQGQEVSSGAVLAEDSGGIVYLVTDGKKLLIPDAPTFNQFHFSWNKIVKVPDVLMMSVPSGVQIY